MATNPNVDVDEIETQEWLDALNSVVEHSGPERAHYLLERLMDKARRSGANLPYDSSTAYVNTIPLHLEAKSPGDQELEHRVRSMIRWNAAVMVLRAQRDDSGLAGTWQALHPQQPCMTWASTTSSMHPHPNMEAMF